MGNSTNDPFKVCERIFNLRTIASDNKFPNAFVVPGSSHFKDIQGSGHFAANLDVLKHENRVSNGGDMGVCD
jgi:hypothetical protein